VFGGEASASTSSAPTSTSTAPAITRSPVVNDGNLIDGRTPSRRSRTHAAAPAATSATAHAPSTPAVVNHPTAERISTEATPNAPTRTAARAAASRLGPTAVATGRAA
jgi:hypothetical protein